ncbi:MbnP family protein [Tenacibaculum sp. HL-MS23]|uniref:MbnP family protein n=1 Tax=Tenacibaculum sp. HL-MS23 TaxID=3077734 RepID=UPI0028FC0B1A|nr:MbnP family protein [Tenacibaculum sp. HL-MS23]WNW00929.1 MbnP family protein [Tenacibaculum sp. HL-MS23]
MKQYIVLFLSILLFSCSSDSDELIKEVSIKINFTQNWDGASFEKSDLSNTELTNKLGTKLTIDKLRYLVSKITLTDAADKATIFEGYKLIDLSDEESLVFNPSLKITEGNYSLAITFGFNNDDNIDGEYADLNTASWNVPMMLGGGYHFMQLDGKYKDDVPNENPYNFHVIRAYNTTTSIPEDTSFIVNLGSVNIKSDANIEVKMNIAEWFKNPNDWDLNEKNTNLMIDFDAQKEMSANGKSGVFSLGTISQ